MDLNKLIIRSLDKAIDHLIAAVGYGPRLDVAEIASAKAILVQIESIVRDETKDDNKDNSDSHAIDPNSNKL